MDHSASWPAYGQHYSRLSGAVNTGPGALAQSNQLNDIQMSATLPRQDSVGGFGTPGPSLLMPARHTLNVSQGGAPSDPSFVNSANLMSTTYDSMLSSFPPAKGHLGSLNMPPSPTLFKAMGKESELNELRGGFSRRGGLPPGTIPPDAGVGLSGSSAVSPAGLFNTQSSPHSWRPADIVSTPSSPFGVLPHEAVMQRTNPEPAAGTPLPQASKSSHDPSESCFADSDLNYRNNVLSVASHEQNSPIVDSSPSTSRTPLMISRSDAIASAADAMSLSTIKSTDFVNYHNNGTGISSPHTPLMNQNYIPHGQFSSMELHGEGRNVFSPESMPAACKNTMFNPSSKKTVSSPDMYGNGISSPASSSSASIPAHNPARVHHHSSSGGNSQLSPMNPGLPTSTGSQTQPRDLSSYSAYSTTPTIPTNSQSFLANQMPSPSSLSVNHGIGFSGVNIRLPLPGGGSQSGQFVSMPSSALGSAAASTMSSSETTNVAYPSVITRTCMSTHATNAYADPSMISATKSEDESKSVTESLQNQLVHTLSGDNTMKLRNVSYDHMIKTSSDIGNETCLAEVDEQTSALLSDIPRNLTCSANKQMFSNATNLLSPNGSALDVNLRSPKSAPLDEMYGGQNALMHHLDAVHGGKANINSQTGLMLDSKHGLPTADQKHIADSSNKRRRRSRKKKYQTESRSESPQDPTIQITPMTPLNANKLSHKMAPLPLSMALHHPPVSSPLVPMDLSGSEMLESSPMRIHCMKASHGDLSSSLHHMNPCVLPKANGDVSAMSCVEPLLAHLSQVSPPEMSHISPPQLPATPVSIPSINCGTSSSLDSSPKLKKSFPSIEDDLGFLAELPPACNIANKQNKFSSVNSYLNYSGKMNSSGGFLESFLKFVKGDSVMSSCSVVQRKNGRGRGRGTGHLVRSFRREISPKMSPDNPLELNPITGLFVSRKLQSLQEIKEPFSSLEQLPDSVSVHGVDSGFSSVDLNSKQSPEKNEQEMVESNPEAPKFSSDDEYSPVGLENAAAFALERISEPENGGQTLESSEKPSRSNSPPLPNNTTVKNEKRPELKIKVIGLQSGNLKTAQKTKRKRRCRKSSSSRFPRQASLRSHEKSQASDEDDIDNDQLDMSGEENSYLMYEKEYPQKFPQRRLSMRKCKEKVIQKRQEKIEKRKKQEIVSNWIPVDEVNDILSSDSDKDGSDFNSDTDPAWTPVRRDGQTRHHRPSNADEDRISRFRSRKRQKSSRLSLHHMKQRRMKKTTTLKEDWDIGENNYNLAAAANEEGSSAQVENIECSLSESLKNDAEEKLFQVGDFIVAVSDLSMENPPLWRIDGKSLLQKFEPFEDKGKIYYKNKSTYAGWINSNHLQYRLANVELIVCERNQFVVEYLRNYEEAKSSNDQLPLIEPSLQKDVLDLNLQKESFEVYIQTLISQALDPNFISEIIKEKDEYFLSHLHEIDLVVDKCKQCILSIVEWNDNLKFCIEQFPDVILSSEDDDFLGVESNCQACTLKPCMQKMSFSGQPYSSVTLLKKQRDQQDAHNQSQDEEFRVCGGCNEIISLYNQIYHQKFKLYTVCSLKVDEIQQADKDKESHVILELCLEDANWINKLFEQTANIWRKCLRFGR